MNREKKNTLSQQRILNAALKEFSSNNYDKASINTICTQNKISKGIIYHYFKDKDELYLLCVQMCFDAISSYLFNALKTSTGTIEQRLQDYFNARLHFFTENKNYLGIFTSAVFYPPEKLIPRISKLRAKFDELNISILAALLESAPIREEFSIESIVMDFSMYMDYFNLHFKSELTTNNSTEALIKEHEERCHRQLHILLYGVLK